MPAYIHDNCISDNAHSSVAGCLPEYSSGHYPTTLHRIPGRQSHSRAAPASSAARHVVPCVACCVLPVFSCRSNLVFEADAVKRRTPLWFQWPRRSTRRWAARAQPFLQRAFFSSLRPWLMRKHSSLRAALYCPGVLRHPTSLARAAWCCLPSLAQRALPSRPLILMLCFFSCSHPCH